MNLTKQLEIATSFPDKFETNQLNLDISIQEFEIFEKGIIAGSMEEKWNVFVLSGIIYFSRSWTDFCIFKVTTSKNSNTVSLSSFEVNRNENEYKSKDIENDTILLKKLIQMFLKREDLYLDPKLKLPFIKKTIKNTDPNNNFKKSIGSNNVGLTIQIHDQLTNGEQKEYFDIIGWDSLKKQIIGKHSEEPLISVHMQSRKNKESFTLYFDNDAQKLLGQIQIKNKQQLTHR